MRRSLGTLVCLLGPLAAILVAVPIAQLPMEAWKTGTTGSRTFELLLAAPAYLAIAAAPGYVYCLFTRGPARGVPVARRWWIRVSMATAIACSAVGLWASTLMWLFGPPSLLSLICAAVLWRRFERAPGPAGAALTPEGLSRARE